MAIVERKSSGIHKEDIRLNKFLAMAGVGSRRGNDELIVSGVVRVNGKKVDELGAKVDPNRDVVTVNGNAVHVAQHNVYILLNKPKDCITTLSDEKDRTTVLDYVRVKQRVFPVGRLDRNTTGALLLTNDGELTNSLIHPRFEVEKTYKVSLDKPLKGEDLLRLKRGVRLEDGMARASEIEFVEGSKRMRVFISIHEGRNREVRRLFETLKYDVKYLDRVSFAGLGYSGLQRGEWRYLTNAEIRFLQELVSQKDSVTTLPIG
jgi:23S rRNA pseudouridine2605 synthase